MTSKEIGELRRRMRPDRTNMTAVRGCYVSASGEILSTFRESVALMSQEDKESYLSIFRRVLSGAQEKNLIDLSFKTSQVADSDEHRLLMALRDSGLDDEQALETFYQTVTGALTSEDHYLILLAHERYDVPFKAKDGAMLEDGSQVFSYVLCAICPVSMAKPALSYFVRDNCFRNITADQFQVVVDYNELMEHPSDKCNIYLKASPHSVRSAKLSISQVDYLIEQQ